MGMTFCYFQSMIHMRNGWDAIYYYAEVHQSRWNSFIHTIFMLGTMTGGFIWVPALFNLNHNQAFVFRTDVCIFYFGLYLVISPIVTLVTVLYYMIPFLYSSVEYDVLETRTRRLREGLIMMAVSLVIQEIFGHMLGGDAPSRIEAIPNAILYAPFYSVSHIFY